MEPAIFVALAGSSIAIITGLISYAALILSKDQKVSEFRQDWINAIRKDVAEFAGLVAMVASLTDQYNFRHSNTWNKAKKVELYEAYWDQIQPQIKRIVELSYHIRLRLNPENDNDHIQRLNDIDRLFVDPQSNLANVKAVEAKLENFLKPFQDMLKREWMRVRRGEFSYRAARTLILTVLLLAAVTLYLVWTGAIAMPSIVPSKS